MELFEPILPYSSLCFVLFSNSSWRKGDFNDSKRNGKSFQLTATQILSQECLTTTPSIFWQMWIHLARHKRFNFLHILLEFINNKTFRAHCWREWNEVKSVAKILFCAAWIWIVVRNISHASVAFSFTFTALLPLSFTLSGKDKHVGVSPLWKKLFSMLTWWLLCNSCLHWLFVSSIKTWVNKRYRLSIDDVSYFYRGTSYIATYIFIVVLPSPM